MKRFLKSILLNGSALIAGNSRGKVIFYHDVFKTSSMCKTPTSLALMRRQIMAAKNAGWIPVAGQPTCDKSFQVQFDDGYRGVYECREDLLSMGIKPTINIPVAMIGKPGYLTQKEVKELQSIGFSFQSHGWNHVWLPECTDDELAHELRDSRAWLANFLQCEVPQICFPRGLFSDRVCKAAVDAGYKEMATCLPSSLCLPSFCDEGVVPRLIPRLLVQDATPFEFLSVLKGGLTPFQRRFLRRQYIRECQ